MSLPRFSIDHAGRRVELDADNGWSGTTLML